VSKTESAGESRKVAKIHVREAVYVGPTEPYESIPPLEDILHGRAGNWTLVEKHGDVYVTHCNPAAVNFEVDPVTKQYKAPHGLKSTTRIPAANLRDVQYEDEPLPAPATAIKGAA
jgi:hypothetical protein